MRLALLMAAVLATGIAAADWLRPHPLLVLALLLVSATWAILAPRRSGQAVLRFLLLLALFGGLRHSFVQTAGHGNLGAWEGQRISLVGTVVGEPEVRPGGSIAYVVAAERVAEEPAGGRVYVTQRAGRAPGYGERVKLHGRLGRPIGPRTPGGFDQSAYLGRQGIYLTLESGPAERMGPGRIDPLRRGAVAVRIRLERVLRESLPEREAALMAGLLFGSRSDLPADIRESFRASGVFHLLAVSGGNIAMLVVPLLGGLQMLGIGKRPASAIAIVAVLFFVFLTGASPSVLRAGLMALLVLLGDLLGRERDALNTLGAAVLLLLSWSPALLFDLGFQLSVGATLGILLFAGGIQQWLTPHFLRLFGRFVGRWLASGLSVTFAAQVMVEPLSLYQFGLFSLIAPIANLLVVLVVEWLVPLGMAVVVLGVAWMPITLVLRVAGGVGLNALTYAIKATASLPFASIEVGKPSVVWVIAWYGGVALIAFPRARLLLTAGLDRAGQRWTFGPGFQRWAAVSVLAGVLVTALTWHLALADPPDLLTVTFLDVGQGDATLIQAPGGYSVLVDSGQAYPPDPAHGRPGYDAGAQVVAPYLEAIGVEHLEYLVLTHPDGDHVGGAPAVLEAVAAGELWLINPAAPERGQAGAISLARARSMPVLLPTEETVVNLGAEVRLELLGPPRQPFQGTRSDDNANCIVMRLVYRQVAMLLACDLEAVAEERLVQSHAPIRSDLLKVSHHGSGHSSTEAFLSAVNPRYAVISAGNGNPFGHPSKEALDRLVQGGAEVWRTDRHGTITVRTDGFRIRVDGSRGSPEAEQYRPLALLGRRLFGAW